MPQDEPTIAQFMTAKPKTISAMATVKEAVSLMSRHQIRHLPVMSPMNPDRVFGVVSDRDLKLVSGLAAADPGAIRLTTICHGSPYLVEPTTPLREVVKTMAFRRVGSALVVRDRELVGIFTTVDACRVLASLLQTSARA